MVTVATTAYLIQKLRELLSQPQGCNLTIKELTAYSAMSRSTIYRNFPAGMQDLCLEMLRQDLQRLLQQKLNSWPQLIEYSISYIIHHRICCLNVYQLLVNQKQQFYLLEMLKQFLLTYIDKQDYGPYFKIFLNKYPYELDFMVAGILYNLMDWFDSQLQAKPEVIIKKLNCGLEMFLFHFNNDTMQ